MRLEHIERSSLIACSRHDIEIGAKHIKIHLEALRRVAHLKYRVPAHQILNQTLPKLKGNPILPQDGSEQSHHLPSPPTSVIRLCSVFPPLAFCFGFLTNLFPLTSRRVSPYFASARVTASARAGRSASLLVCVAPPRREMMKWMTGASERARVMQVVKMRRRKSRIMASEGEKERAG